MAIFQIVVRHSFTWMMIAGLLLAVRGLTNAPDEVRIHDGKMWGLKLGLTDLPDAHSGEKLSSR